MFLGPLVNAQLNHPKASPFTKIEQEVGLSKITVKYSRPAVRGRTIFGDLVPYGRIWRVGANASTKITVDTDVTILGNNLPKGTYALYAFPKETSWEVVFHGNTEHWGDGRKAYSPEEDIFRVTIIPQKIEHFQENFLITFDAITHNEATMQWIWENTKIAIPITVPTDDLMLREINTALKNNPTAQTYYEAARYFQEQGIEPKKALGYLNKAITLGGDTYYFHRVKSLVEADMQDYHSAIKSAQHSLELAQKQGKDEFVRMNAKNINHWTKELQESKH